MEIWDNTTVIVTSDHWLRLDIWSKNELGINENNAVMYYKGIDHRIPFMLKIAGQKEDINYDKPFNTVLTHDLILALLKNELSNSDDVVEWIDNERSKWWIPDYSNKQNKNILQRQ